MPTNLGTCTISAQTDHESSMFVTEEATRLGISQSELIRRLLHHYRQSQLGKLDCPHCEETLTISL